METISNIANTATSTVTTLLYGENATKNNETAGKEPVAGKEGKGTVAEPYDLGNAPTPLATAGTEKKSFIEEPKKDEDFLKLAPETDGPQVDSSAPKTTTDTSSTPATGMPILPLVPEAPVSSGDAKTSTTSATEATGVTTGTTDKVWKETPLDDISRSGAPGAGPEAPATVSAAAPTTAATTTSTETKAPVAADTPAIKDTKKEPEAIASADVSPKTSTAADGKVDATKPAAATESKGLAEDKSSKEASKEPLSKTSSDEERKGGKMSHLKEKLKGKLHIGSKDK